jgi:hypothetical protein
MIKGVISISLAVSCVLGVVLLAEAAPAGPLAQVIEGAKKEGTATMTLKSSVPPKSMVRLEKGIREKFGVNLAIKSVPSTSMPKDLSDAIMERKLGASPTYDVMSFMSFHITEGIKNGVLEKVNWEPLLTGEVSQKAILGTPPHDERLYGYGLIYYSGRGGIIYNPEKVSSREVPKSMGGLSDPKWKGRVGIFNYPATWTVLAFVSGKERIVSDLRAILKSGAIQGRYADLHSRYLLGEIWMALTSTAYLKAAWDQKMPAAWQGLDPVEVEHFSLVLTKGAKHPNAGKLVILYLASQDGAKFMLEEGGAGNYLYPGNFEFDIHHQEEKQGFRHISGEEKSIVDFQLSDENAKWQKEIKQILDGG